MNIHRFYFETIDSINIWISKVKLYKSSENKFTHVVSMLELYIADLRTPNSIPGNSQE